MTFKADSCSSVLGCIIIVSPIQIKWSLLYTYTDHFQPQKKFHHTEGSLFYSRQISVTKLILLTEPLLLQHLLQGDEKAFKLLVDTHKNMVYNTVLGFIQHADDADDVTQNVFIKVFETISSFKEQSKLSTWIYRVSVNESLDFIRHKNRKRRWAMITNLFNNNNEPLYQQADPAHPGVLMENKEKAAVLFKAINQLPDKQKTAFLLQKTQDCTQQQIAEIMLLSEGAVESLLTRAKANLKKLLISYYSAWKQKPK